jgi:hypothetical protein
MPGTVLCAKPSTFRPFWGSKLNRLPTHRDLFRHFANRQLAVKNQHLTVLQRYDALGLLHAGGTESDGVGACD